jgi:hypothetical protein
VKFLEIPNPSSVVLYPSDEITIYKLHIHVSVDHKVTMNTILFNVDTSMLSDDELICLHGFGRGQMLLNVQLACASSGYQPLEYYSVYQYIPGDYIF